VIKNLLATLFAKHTTSDGGFMVALLLAGLLVAGIVSNNLFIRSYPLSDVSYTYGFTLICFLGGSATYLFSAKKQA
jgi:hypothetical protein